MATPAALDRYYTREEVLAFPERFDRFTKRRLYQEKRVPVYWIIDAANRRAEVWTPEATAPVFESERLTWHPAGAAEALVVEIAALLES